MIKRIRVPACYEQFHCVDTACTDSCCAGWQVDVDNVSWEQYKKVTGDFGKYLNSVMVEIPGEEGQFQLRKDGSCPFLNASGLCDMYSELGEKSLCNTCTNYPRFMEDYGELREVGIAFSCPEAARLILSDVNPMGFLEGNISEAEEDSFVSDVMWRTRTMGVTKTLVSDEEVDFIIHSDVFDEGYFKTLFQFRQTAFALVQNRKFSIKDRVLLYLDYGMCVQDAFDHEEGEQLVRLKEIYGKEEWLLSRLLEIKGMVAGLEKDAQDFLLYGEPIARGELCYRLIPEYIAVLYQELKHCKPEWGPLLTRAEEILHKGKTRRQYRDLYAGFEAYMKEREYEYEHWLSYVVFKYFLKSYFDDDIYGKVQFGVMGYFLLKELGVCQWVVQGGQFTKADQIELFHLYSRELEHSDENYDLFVELLHTEAMCNGGHLRAMLCE